MTLPFALLLVALGFALAAFLHALVRLLIRAYQRRRAERNLQRAIELDCEEQERKAERLHVVPRDPDDWAPTWLER